MNVKRLSHQELFLVTVVLLLLVGFGVLMVGSFYRASVLFDDPYFFIKRHIAWMLMGALCYFLTKKIKVELIEKLIPMALLLSLSLLLLTFVDGIGVSFLGARRWISIGRYTFQPSEFSKIAMVLYLALVLDRKQRSSIALSLNIIPTLVVVALFCTLIYLQNDFSSSVFLGLISLCMFFLAGIPMRYFVGLGIILIPVVGSLLLSQFHRVERIIAFLSPTIDPQGTGYQVLSSRSAIERGGLLGNGWGQGSGKLGAVPEAHSDFIFAVLSEELGFLGLLPILGIIAMQFYAGTTLARQAQNNFFSLAIAGSALVIMLQTLVNISVNIGLLPPTGIPLPYMSAGGSSIIVVIIFCGLISKLGKEQVQ